MKRSRLFKFAMFVALASLTAVPVHIAQSQSSVEPITKTGLIKALADRALSGRKLISEIQKYGVAFQLTPNDEQDIRRAGSYLGNKSLDDLIMTVRENYRGIARPSVAFLYKDKQIQIYNLTESELYIWGTKLDEGPPAMDKDFVVLSPRPFFYLIEGYEELALKQIPEGGEARPVYYIFVKDKQERKFTLKCLLWTTVKDHNLTVRTQNLGVEDGWLDRVTKKEEQQPKPDLPVAHITWVAEPVSSPKETFPFAIRVTIQTTAPISPRHFVIACSDEIAPADQQPGPGGVSFGLQQTTRGAMYEIRVQAPPLTPQEPMTLVIISARHFSVLTLKRVVE